MNIPTLETITEEVLAEFDRIWKEANEGAGLEDRHENMRAFIAHALRRVVEAHTDALFPFGKFDDSLGAILQRHDSFLSPASEASNAVMYCPDCLEKYKGAPFYEEPMKRICSICTPDPPCWNHRHLPENERPKPVPNSHCYKFVKSSVGLI